MDNLVYRDIPIIGFKSIASQGIVSFNMTVTMVTRKPEVVVHSSIIISFSYVSTAALIISLLTLYDSEYIFCIRNVRIRIIKYFL